MIRTLFVKYRVMLYILGILICFALFLWPLLRPGFIVTDDGDWMIIRLSAFYQSLREGQFPVRLLGRLNYSYGYPVSNFLYPGYLYIGSIIHAVGIPFVTTIKLIFGASVIIAGISVYAWARRFASPFASFLGMVTFLFSPYLLFDVYRRGSVGEVLAIAAAAVCLYAIEAHKKKLLTLSIAMLLLSHNSLALMGVPMIILYGLLQKRWYVLVSMLFATAMTTFFWFPALYERQFVLFDNIIVSDPMQYFAVNAQWFLLSISQLSLYVTLLWKRDLWRKSLPILIFIFGIFIVLTLPVTSPIWQFESFAKLFQFPYRFLSMAIIIGGVLSAVAIDRLRKRIWMDVLLILFVAGISCVSIFVTYQHIGRSMFPDQYYSTNEATTTVANEYMPKWVASPPTERTYKEVEFFQGRGTIEPLLILTHKVIVEVNAQEDSIIQINSVYYPGWGALVNGVPAEISYDNPRGVIRFPIKTGNNYIIAEFRETIPRFIATSISVIAVILFGIVLILPQKTNKQLLQWGVSFLAPITKKARKQAGLKNNRKRTV